MYHSGPLDKVIPAQQKQKERVLADGYCSLKVMLRQGVSQVGVLSRTLFILFINDLVPELPKGVITALYTDDFVFWCCEEYATIATYRMQLALDTLGKQIMCYNQQREVHCHTLLLLPQNKKITSGFLPAHN